MPNETGYESAKKALIFLSGALIGSALSYYFTKRHYQKIVDRDVEDVMERFEKDIQKEEVPEDKPVCHVLDMSSREDKVIYGEALKKSSQFPPEDYTKDDNAIELDEEDFVEDDDYDKETIIYYTKNDVLTDQYDRVIDIKDIFKDDAINMIDGSTMSLKEFAKRGGDIGYIRNRYLRTDYEVCFEDQDAPETALREGDLND